MNILKKIFNRFFLSFIFIVSIIIILTNIINTLNIICNIANHLIPGLKISNVNGNWNNIVINKIYYDISGIEIKINKLQLSLDFNYLTHGKIYIKALEIYNSKIIIQKNKFKSSSLDLFDKKNNALFFLKNIFILHNLILHNAYFSINNTSIKLNKFTTGVSFQRKILTIEPSYIQGLLIYFPNKTLIQPYGNYSVLKKKINKYLLHSKRKLVNIDSISGIIKEQKTFFNILNILITHYSMMSIHLIKLISLLNFNLHDLIIENINIANNKLFTINSLQLQTSIINKNIILKLLKVNLPKHSISVYSKVLLNTKKMMILIINFKTFNSSIYDEKIQFTINNVTFGNVYANLRLYGIINVHLSFNANLLKTKHTITSSMLNRCKKFLYTNMISYQELKNINLFLKEILYDYYITLKINFTNNNSPPSNLFVLLGVHSNNFHVIYLKLLTNNGNINLNTILNRQIYSNTTNWHYEITFNHINITPICLNCSIYLNGKIIIYHNLYDIHKQFTLLKVNIIGKINKNPLVINGILNKTIYQKFYMLKFIFSLGENKLFINGKFNDHYILNLVIRAPKLDNITPNRILLGQITGNIKAFGDFNYLQLITNFNGYNVHYKELSILNFVLKSKILFSDTIQGNINCLFEHFKKNNIFIDKFILIMEGNENLHHLILRINMKNIPCQGILLLYGSFNRNIKQWQGILTKASLNINFGTWHLMHAMHISYQYTLRKLLIGPHIWCNNNSQIYLPNKVEFGTSGCIDVIFKRINSAILNLFTSSVIHINGTLNGVAHFKWVNNNLLYGKLLCTGYSIKIKKSIQDKNLFILLQKLIFSVSLQNTLFKINWLAKINKNSQFHGQIQIKKVNNEHILYGNVIVNNFILNLINCFIPQNVFFRGKVNANLNFTGNMYYPKLYGYVFVNKVLIKSNSLPINIIDSNLKLNFIGSRAILHGIIKHVQDKVNLIGDINWNKIQNWYVHIKAQGNLTNITTPEIKFNILPNIILDITPKICNINGNINVPWARLEIKDIPQTIRRISKDETLLDNNFKPIKTKNNHLNIPIHSNLLIHFGKDVIVNAFDLKAMLYGDLTATKNKQGFKLNGQVNIPSGHFHAYGQDLIINKGELVFSGPIEQPYINIEAIRNPDFTEDNVIAGILINGILNHLKIKFFSKPIKSQQEIISYLLRGQGLNTSNIDSNTMTSMLIGMGIAQSNHIINKIGHIFGIHELILDTLGIGNKSQVVISGYITPRLHIKYGVNIFDSLATLTVRYRLIPKLYLEIISSVNQALDLMYQFEF